MSGDAGQLLDEATIMAKWAEIGPWIDHMACRIQNANEFVVHAGSALALDDGASHPYEVSHCVRSCLNAGVGHLHAMKRLIIDDRLIHSEADYSLIRGALENFGTAFWVLHADERIARITRALRWMAQNFKDQAKAVEATGMTGVKSREENLATVQQVATDAGCGQVPPGYASTDVMKYADEHSTTDPYIPWQVCSGFAHGRPWATLGMNEIQHVPGQQQDGVVTISVTADYPRLLSVTLPAWHLMTDVLKRLDELSKSPT
jgi:hypothetical protein